MEESFNVSSRSIDISSNKPVFLSFYSHQNLPKASANYSTDMKTIAAATTNNTTQSTDEHNIIFDRCRIIKVVMQADVKYTSRKAQTMQPELWLHYYFGI